MAKRRNPELEERRELLQKMVKNANRKISRLKSRGINIEGTQWDVKRDTSKIGRYNMNQLNSYERQLSAFNSRANTFHKGAMGTVIPGEKWRELKSYEAKGNAAARRWENAVGDVYIKQVGGTIKERNEQMRSQRMRASGEATPRLFYINHEKPENVNGVKAVDKLIALHKKRISKTYMQDQINNARHSFSKMFHMLDDTESIKKLSELTDHQFLILVKETPFAESTSLKYLGLQDRASGKSGRYLSGVINSESGIIHEYLETAKTYPEKKITRKTNTRS